MNLSMQAASLELEQQFAKCTEDLDSIAKKLDADFEGSDAYKRNPLQILQRVKALQDDLPRVQEDWQRVMVAKQTIIDVARQQQVASHRALKQLNLACGLPEREELQEPFERFQDIREGWEKENASRVEEMQQEIYGHTLLAPEELDVEVLRTAAARRQTEDADDGTHEEVEGEPGVEQNDEGEGDGGEEVVVVPAHSISEAEFTSVSNIVRGRCKREECNELLDLIISKTRRTRQGAPVPLTTADLVGMGARVTGQTGGSRLATLRTLKRVTISKDAVLLNPKYLPLK
uniref:Protein FAM33A n=1 Tax=Hemiselmis andersenii TaxID=464988 RepID=A0A7S1HNX1_HEMAN